MYFPHTIPSISVAFPVSDPVRVKPDEIETLDPVDIFDTKEHLNVTHDADDVYIASLITSARIAIERAFSLAMITQTVTALYRGPAASLELPFGPVQEITSVTRTDDNGDTTDEWVTADLLVIDRRISVLDGSLASSGADVSTVVYTAGFGDAPSSVPEDLKHAVKVWVADLYQNRGSFDVGSIAVANLPGAVRYLLHGYDRRGV